MSSFIPCLSISVLSDSLIQYSSGIIPISTTELNLKQTLLGGQSFRWFEQSPNEFVGVLHFYIVRLQYENEKLHFKFYVHKNTNSLLNECDREKESATILHKYFQLSVKLEDLFEQWCKSDERFRNKQIPTGIRVLDQDPLENLICFICSSNNNVQRITKMIKTLSEIYGKEIGTLNGTTYYQFPTIDELDQSDLEKDLRKLNFGYRARYIHKAVQYLKHTINDPSYFDRLKSSSVQDARSELLKIMGVGRKVADCVLLMSLGKQDVVPVDTHIHSIAVTYYGQRKNSQLSMSNYNNISSFFQQLWQPYAGWAQAAAFSNELRSPTSKTTSVKRSKMTNHCKFIKYEKEIKES
ncbi:unnamed protein product [Adineta ricciae]|uniref:DNA-(apurinic or apyrimidinic site) lyase n=1 Tax=Adineta ricciae TaxID=249248 RepID=A0A814NRY3_ADIRI|nr:unnamed protein product [Adineta ricciae]